MRKAITTDTTTLPIAIALGSLLWILPEAGNLLLWGGWFVAILTAYAWMEMNARMQLLRERSRMVSITFFISLTAVPLLHNVSLEALLSLSIILCYACLFSSYQERRPESKLFHAFLLLGLGSLLLPQLLWLLPLFLFSCSLHLRSLTPGSLAGALIGLLLPIVGVAVWGLIQWDFSLISGGIEGFWHTLTQTDMSYWETVYTATPLTLPTEEWQFLVSASCTLLLSYVAIINQVQTSYLDKIRVRMFYYMMALIQCGLTLLLILFPKERWLWLYLLITNGAPLIAHYLTLTRGWVPTTLFWLSLIGFFLLTFFNYQTKWILSLIYS
jgi:hypothetical protein